MTLRLKSVSNVNLKNKPFFSKNFKKEMWLNAIKSNTLSDLNKIDDDDLVIICLQDLYGYRTGLIGYLATLLTSTLDKVTPSTFILSSLVNLIARSHFHCNDLNVLSGIISILNRAIPFLNYGVWDFKQTFAKNLNMYINENHSMNGIFNLASNFLFKPFYDSGLCILSNKKCHESGFEKLDKPTNTFVNEGFLWTCFKKENTFILIVTLNITQTEDNTPELNQLLLLVEKLEERFDNCEIYISGDFKMNLEQCKHLFEDDFKILNHDDTNYLLYKNNHLKNPIYSKFKIDENYIYSYNLTKKRHLSPIQQLLNSKKMKPTKEPDTKENEPKEEPHELQEIKLVSFDQNELDKDTNKINFYKTLSVITENPHIENYFYKTKSSSSSEKSLSTDDEWTKIEQII